jgi:hypothetical protein
MRIGLISDTHIPNHAKELPEQLKNLFHAVDLILHAGDIYTISVLDELECLAPVLAAEGDDDPLSTSTDRRVKVKHILNIDGVTIWLTHARPWSWPPDSRETPNIIVCGHTHTAALENLQGDILLVNPGSPTFPQYKLELGTVALLTISSGKAEANIVQLQ